MKKLIAILLLAPAAAPGAKLCVALAADNTRYDEDAKTWSFTNGGTTISGEAKCVGSNFPSAFRAVPKNGGNDTPPDNGGNVCVCRRTAPSLGVWVFKVGTDSCGGYCAYECAHGMGYPEFISEIMS